MKTVTYLDHNATSPLRPAAREALLAALESGGNPSSVHGTGRGARRRLEDAREAVAVAVGAAPAQVVFTSGGSEANALAIGCAEGERVFVSAVEHPSVLAARAEIVTLPVDRYGVVDLAALDGLLAETGGAALVSVMAANNETGVLQPIAHVAEIARRHGARVHCDAVQALGRVPLDLPALGIHMLSLSAHKVGGAPGVGALVLADGEDVAPLIRGGGQERGRRAGTENVPAIAAFGAAAAEIAQTDDEAARLASLRDKLERRLGELNPDIEIFASGVPRLANTSCFALPDLSAETALMALDLRGVAVSSGSACSSGKVGPSHVLAAMGVPQALARGALRVSLGWSTMEDDIERFTTAWTAVAAGVRSRAA